MRSLPWRVMNSDTVEQSEAVTVRAKGAASTSPPPEALIETAKVPAGVDAPVPIVTVEEKGGVPLAGGEGGAAAPRATPPPEPVDSAKVKSMDDVGGA